MMTRIPPRLALLCALLMGAGCETTDDITAEIGSGIRQLGDAVSGAFRGSDASDDPIYKCQAEGHTAGTAEYEACVQASVAEHCTQYGKPSSPEYSECLTYYKDLQMVRRQVRAIGIVR